MLHLPEDGAAPVLRAKFGGLPWGLPAAHWPSCRECGKPMSCLAQIPVAGHLNRLGPLADMPEAADRVLHIFTCERPTICSFWEAEGGANAAFFAPASSLDPTAEMGAGAEDAPLLPEVWIAGWTPHEDAVPEDLAAHYVDEQAFYVLPEPLQFPNDFKTSQRTKLGGVPYWTGNGPCEPPQPPFRYTMQIDKLLLLPEAPDGYVDLANFCSDGTGYVFVDSTSDALPTLFAINR